MRSGVRGLCALLLLFALGGCGPFAPQSCGGATCAAHTETLAAGPYVVDVGVASYPPVTDEPTQVTVTPQNRALRLFGDIEMLPGLGTDATTLRYPLSSVDHGATLGAFIHLPVRGAWDLEVRLIGPRGAGVARFPIVVAAPGAIPLWLGWLIGAAPLLALGWIIWRQRRYRRELLALNGRERC
jgi:hypothetical protein